MNLQALSSHRTLFGLIAFGLLALLHLAGADSADASRVFHSDARLKHDIRPL